MTDKKITKAMQHHIKRLCYECPLRDSDSSCSSQLCENALDLINRQQAEIERLQNKLNTVKQELIETIPLIEDDIKTAKSEAYKEFAERLKERATIPFGNLYVKRVLITDVDNLLKEMGCDNA